MLHARYDTLRFTRGKKISATVNQTTMATPSWHSNLFETVDIELRLYIRNPGTVVWLFIERKKNGPCRYIDSYQPPSWALVASPDQHFQSLRHPRMLPLNFNNGKAIRYVGKFTYVARHSACALRMSLLILARSSSRRCVSLRYECDLQDKNRSPLSIRFYSLRQLSIKLDMHSDE